MSCLLTLPLVSGGCVCIDAVASLQVKGQLVDAGLLPVTVAPVEIRLLHRGDTVHPSPIRATSDVQGNIDAVSGYALYGGTVPFFLVWLPPHSPAPPVFDSVEVAATVRGESQVASLPLGPGMLVRTRHGGRLDLGVLTLAEAWGER